MLLRLSTLNLSAPKGRLGAASITSSARERFRRKQGAAGRSPESPGGAAEGGRRFRRRAPYPSPFRGSRTLRVGLRDGADGDAAVTRVCVPAFGVRADVAPRLLFADAGDDVAVGREQQFGEAGHAWERGEPRGQAEGADARVVRDRAERHLAVRRVYGRARVGRDAPLRATAEGAAIGHPTVRVGRLAVGEVGYDHGVAYPLVRPVAAAGAAAPEAVADLRGVVAPPWGSGGSGRARRGARPDNLILRVFGLAPRGGGDRVVVVVVVVGAAHVRGREVVREREARREALDDVAALGAELEVVAVDVCALVLLAVHRL